MCTAIRELMEDSKTEGIILSGQIFHLIKESPEKTGSQIAKELECTLEDVQNVRKIFKI